MEAQVARNPERLTITQKYGNEDNFVELLERIGVPATSRRKLVDDDFDSMQSLVSNYSNDFDSFATYLRGLNKTFGR